jgi:uncharacterized Zn-binding protein involved in type VI secretion
MPQPAAKQGDRVVAVDIHLIQPTAPVSPLPIPHPFSGVLDGDLSGDVTINGGAAATLGSTATNTPAHVPLGGKFVVEPRNRAQVVSGSGTVLINGKPAARAGDTALTCNDPVDLPVGTVVATSTVLIGG